MGKADPRAQCVPSCLGPTPSLAFPVLRGSCEKSAGLAVPVWAAMGTCEQGSRSRAGQECSIPRGQGVGLRHRLLRCRVKRPV